MSRSTVSVRNWALVCCKNLFSPLVAGLHARYTRAGLRSLRRNESKTSPQIFPVDLPTKAEKLIKSDLKFNFQHTSSMLPVIIKTNIIKLLCFPMGLPELNIFQLLQRAAIEASCKLCKLISNPLVVWRPTTQKVVRKKFQFLGHTLYGWLGRREGRLQATNYFTESIFVAFVLWRAYEYWLVGLSYSISDL